MRAESVCECVCVHVQDMNLGTVVECVHAGKERPGCECAQKQQGANDQCHKLGLCYYPVLPNAAYDLKLKKIGPVLGVAGSTLREGKAESHL